VGLALDKRLLLLSLDLEFERMLISFKLAEGQTPDHLMLMAAVALEPPP